MTKIKFSPVRNLSFFEPEKSELRKTAYTEGSRAIIIGTFFHHLNLGEEVKILNRDNFSYHVTDGKGNFWWVNENQLTPVNVMPLFKTDLGVYAAFYVTTGGEYTLKMITRMPKTHYYSALNAVGAFFEESIVPLLNKKHPSQLHGKAVS